MFVLYVSLIWVITAFLKTATTSRGWGGGGGGGGGTGTLDFKWQGWSNGDKNTKKKMPGPKFNPPCKKRKKIPSRDTQKLSGIFRLFWMPKRIPYSNQGTKKILAKIFLSKFQTQTILRSFPSYEIWSTRKGRYIHHLSGIRRYMLGKSYDLKEKDAIK